MTFAKASKLFLICASAIVLSGCWISFYDAGYYAPCSGAIYVYVAPPPPRYAIPPRPVATAVWIGGYWSWTRRAYDWVTASGATIRRTTSAGGRANGGNRSAAGTGTPGRWR